MPQIVFTSTAPEWEARDILAAIFLQKNPKVLMPPCCSSCYVHMGEIQMGEIMFSHQIKESSFGPCLCGFLFSIFFFQ